MAVQPIRAHLAMRRWPVRGLAAVVGVSEDHLTRVVNGERPGSPDLRHKLAAFIGVDVESLFA